MLGLPRNPLVGDVEIRLARPEERLRWDRLMAEGHELGFLRFLWDAGYDMLRCWGRFGLPWQAGRQVR